MKIDWKVKKVKLSEIKEYEANPRTITEKGLKDLKQSIERFGQAEPLVVNTDMVLIGGHARKIALQSLDYETCDVIIPSKKLTDKQVQELNIRLNKNIAGTFDFDILTEFFETDDLIEWGFESFEFDTKEINEKDEWVGMPDFEAKDTPLKIIIAFETEYDRKEFESKYDIEYLVKQEKTWSTWFPYKDKEDLQSVRYE